MAVNYSDEFSGVDRWQSLRSDLPRTVLPPKAERLLIVAAHPDDETLGAGGLLSEAEAGGLSVTVVVATDGDASHPRSPTHRPRDLAAVRRREVYAALAILAPSADVVLLGLPDGRLAGVADELEQQLQSLVERPTMIVSPWRGDRHPDHETCAEVLCGMRGERAHWQYPIWAWHWDDPAAPRFPKGAMHALTLRDASVEAKARAINCFESQCAPLSDQPGDETVLAPAMLAHFRQDHEIFLID